MKAARLLLIALVVVLVGGCGSATAGSRSSAPEPGVLHVVRTTTIPSDYSAFERTITNAAAVQHLYHTALALPKAPSGIINCPNNIGLVYHLSFQQTSQDGQMTLDASGCQFLSISKTDMRQTNPAFIALVAQVIGLPSLLIKKVA